jgi:GT2 family glycosyltransferase
MNLPKVYIVVLNYRNYKDTLACLESIFQLDYLNFSVVVVDNDSQNESSEIISRWMRTKASSRINFIQSKKNLGFAGGNNLGIRFALAQKDSEYVWVLNNDTILEKDALNEIMDTFRLNPSLGICGSKLMYSWDKSKIQGFGGTLLPLLGTSRFVTNSADISQIDYVIGASMCFSRRFLEDVGLFSEEYFLFYEEPDICLRAKKKGYTIGCATRSIVYHKEGASMGGSSKKKSEKSRISDFYMVRSRILFTRKFYPYFLPTVYLGLLYTIFNRIERKQFDRIMMILEIMIHPSRMYSE